MKKIKLISYQRFMDDWWIFLHNNPRYHETANIISILRDFGLKSIELGESSEVFEISDEEYTWFMLKWS